MINIDGYQTIDKVDIMNQLIKTRNYKRYLEIGVAEGYTFNNIEIEHKESVDPIQLGATTHVMTSDEFFNGLKDDDKWDMIFIDGLHEHEQCYRDIENALKHLSDYGIIICHDMNPLDEKWLDINNNIDFWTGDVYKSLLRIASERDDVYVRLLEDVDCGLGIINRRRVQPTHINWDVDFNEYQQIKPYALHCVKYEDWEQEMGFNLYTICCIAKQEKDYIYDWVDYHIRLGFDRIIIYDNNDSSSPEHYYDILKEFIEKRQVEIRQCRDKKAWQQEAYNEYIREQEFYWTAIIDVDEFFAFTSQSRIRNIKEFLSLIPEAEECLVPWKCMKSRSIDDKRPFYEYNEAVPNEARRDSDTVQIGLWHKTLYKVGGFKGWATEHIPQLDMFNTIQCYDESGERCLSQPLFMYKYSSAEPSRCYLKHYITRDINAFFYNKYLRGHAGVANTAQIDGYTTSFWNQNMNYFANINRDLTVQEQQYILDKGFKFDIVYRPTVIFNIHLCYYDIEYYKRLFEIIHKCSERCDSLSSYNYYKDVEIASDEKGYITYNQGLSFNDTTTIWECGFDLPKLSSTVDTPNYYLQEPLVFSIGYPINYKNSMEFLDIIQNSILNPDKFLQCCRYLTFFNSGNNSITYTGDNCVRYDENDFNWLDVNSELCKQEHVEDKHIMVDANAILTNLSTYKRIINSISLEDTNDLFIAKCASEGLYTTYHQQSSMWCNRINNFMCI